MGTPTETMRRRITWGDLDSLGIVFYPRYYEWIDEASHVFFDKIGLNLGRLLRERGIIFALLETGCRYLRPGRYHDEIEIFTGLSELRDKNFLKAGICWSRLTRRGYASRSWMKPSLRRSGSPTISSRYSKGQSSMRKTRDLRASISSSLRSLGSPVRCRCRIRVAARYRSKSLRPFISEAFKCFMKSSRLSLVGLSTGIQLCKGPSRLTHWTGSGI